jgi:hypothetical protein
MADEKKSKAERFRTEAQKALDMAERSDAETRTQLLHIARVYRQLADKVDPPADADGAPNRP